MDNLDNCSYSKQFGLIMCKSKKERPPREGTLCKLLPKMIEEPQQVLPLNGTFPFINTSDGFLFRHMNTT